MNGGIKDNMIEILKDLDYYNKRKYSQFGEEIIAEAILNQIGIKNKFFVDIGAGSHGNTGESNTRYFLEKGWNGLSFDKNKEEGIIQFLIIPENVKDLLILQGCPKEFDFLNVDIDSFDYEIIEKVLTNYYPSLVCAEINATLPYNSSLKLKYEEGYTWDNTNKYGFSFKAGEKLFNKFNYSIVYNQENINIFAVRNDLINFPIPKIEHKQEFHHPINPNVNWEEV